MGIDIPFFKKRKGKGGDGSQSPSQKAGAEELEALKKRLRLYRSIIEKYRVQIEEGERKTIPELRVLVDPDDSEARKIAERIASSIEGYSFEKNFRQAAENAFDFVSREIGDEQAPVDFWMSFKEVIETGAADEMDKALLLCSVLIALGNQTAKVIVEEGRRHVFVGYEFEGKYFLCDASHKTVFEGEREELVSRHLESEELVYEFNNKEYNEL